MQFHPSIDAALQAEIDPAFAARARLILDEIVRRRPRTIVDAGCGRGFYLRMLSHLSFPEEVLGYDMVTDHLHAAGKLVAHDRRISVARADVCALPIGDESVDLVICSEVLEHLNDPAAAVNELWRVLKPHGCALFTVPSRSFPFLWDPINWLLMRSFGVHVPKEIHWAAGIWADHERLYSATELVDCVGTRLKADAVVPVVRACWPFSHFLLYGVGKNLVELGGFRGMSRFRRTMPGPFSRMLAQLMRWPSRVFDRELLGDSAVNLFLAATK